MIGTLVKRWAGARDDRRPLFERLMGQHHRQAYNMAFRLTGNATDAEDLVQETFVRAFRFFHRYDDTLPFNSWLYRIMTNVHIDTARKRSRIRTVSLDGGVDNGRTWELPDDGAQVDAQLMDETLQEPIQLGLRAMNAEFRTAVILADVEGLSYEEIAQMMDTSIGTVRSRIHRGRKQLRTYLEQTGEEVWL